VIFHNLSGYDSHLFIKNLGKTQGQIDCIPNNEEKHISFSKRVNDENKKFKYKIRFIDSSKFMSSSLDKLVNNLKPDQFKNLKEQFNDIDCWCERESFHMIGLTLWKNYLKEIFHLSSHFIQI